MASKDDVTLKLKKSHAEEVKKLWDRHEEIEKELIDLKIERYNIEKKLEKFRGITEETLVQRAKRKASRTDEEKFEEALDEWLRR